MAMETYYQNPYVQNQMKYESYTSPILLKPRTSPNVQDYSIPLHVDCSVEYELPDCAKPPQGVKVEPLLMIHPCHFRNLERQRRRPFENNMPQHSSAILHLEQHPQQPKQQQMRTNNNNAIQQKQNQQIIISNRNNNANNPNNFTNNNYSCDFTAHLLDYQLNATNSHTNNSNVQTNNNNNNTNNIQRYKNSNLVRNHPYAMPCAPRYADIHYSHLPTLIFNV